MYNKYHDQEKRQEYTVATTMTSGTTGSCWHSRRMKLVGGNHGALVWNDAQDTETSQTAGKPRSNHVREYSTSPADKVAHEDRQQHLSDKECAVHYRQVTANASHCHRAICLSRVNKVHLHNTHKLRASLHVYSNNP